MSRPLGRVAAIAAAALVALYALAVGAMWWGQELRLFRPQTIDPAQPLAREVDVHERSVDVPGARLSMLELRLPDPKGVVFYLHGNSGNLANWFVNTDLYRRAGFDLVMLDYRGYGKSSGRISSEAQLHADVQAAWDAVAARYHGRKRVFIGRSLGSGLAAALAARVQPELTLLVSPYASMAELAREHFPWVPSPVLRYPLRTDVAITAIQTPVVLVHGERDRLIPLAHSRTLLALARSARLVVVPGAAHDDLHKFEAYRQALSDALDALR